MIYFNFENGIPNGLQKTEKNSNAMCVTLKMVVFKIFFIFQFQTSIGKFLYLNCQKRSHLV